MTFECLNISTCFLGFFCNQIFWGYFLALKSYVGKHMTIGTLLYNRIDILLYCRYDDLWTSHEYIINALIYYRYNDVLSTSGCIINTLLYERCLVCSRYIDDYRYVDVWSILWCLINKLIYHRYVDRWSIPWCVIDTLMC